jgi:hypothetical protein
MCIPSSDWPVDARIWVSPAASTGSAPAITFGRPALSTNTRASSMFGSTPVPATAASIIGRNAATRTAVASAPPGLLTNRTWSVPSIARATKSDSRLATYANGSPGFAGWPIPGSGSGGGPLFPPGAVRTTIATAIRRMSATPASARRLRPVAFGRARTAS